MGQRARCPSPETECIAYLERKREVNGWLGARSPTVSDMKQTGIDRFLVVVVVIDRVFIEVRADQRVVTEHFVMNGVLGVRVDVVRIRGSFVALLIDALIHLTFDSTPFCRAQILNDSRPTDESCGSARLLRMK